MPFLVITGTYHLCGERNGKPTGFQPDGDSFQFEPDDPELLKQLDQVGQPFRLTSIGSTQLRFEGIDALELHFGGSHQPRPLADDERDYLTGLLAMNPVAYKPPDEVTVQAPAARDGTKGFILTRSLEAHGRPVSFAYAGAPPAPNGSEVTLKPTLLRKSLNYRSLASGHSYPLFYDTLFADLRAVFTKAAVAARTAKKGLWKSDRTTRGTSAKDQADLEEHAVVFPKLFRRLTSYLATGGALDGFLPWLKHDEEQVLDLRTGNFTHFDNVVRVTAAGKVKLAQPPETLVFVSAKAPSAAVAPWLRH